MRELRRQPRVAKGNHRLIGQVTQQGHVAGAQAVPGGHLHREHAEIFADVTDRHVGGGARPGTGPGREGRHPRGGEGKCEGHGDAPGTYRTRRGLGHSRKQVGGVWAIAEPAAEVGERIVRLGGGTEGEPIGQPERPAAEGAGTQSPRPPLLAVSARRRRFCRE